MAKPNMTKMKIVEKLEEIKNSLTIVGEHGISTDINNLIEQIKKDL